MRKWLPLIAVSLGSFILMVDVTIVNVALASMATDLSTSFSSLQWVIDAYALALAVLLLGAGAVADVSGPRRTFLVGIGLFTAASVVCGLAPDAGLLVTARAAQGIGGAAMFATTFALINASYSGRDRGTAYGVFGAISGAAAALGPVFGGLLTQGISWRWIFFVNVPIGVVTILVTLAVVPEVLGRAGRRVDVAGTAAFTVAAAALTFALISTSTEGWTAPLVLVLLAVAVAGLIAFVSVEARVRQPLIELSLLRKPAFSGVVVSALVLSFSAFGVLTYTTIWTQSVLGLSPVEAGLVSLPQPLLSAAVSLLAGRFMHRLPRWMAIGGGLVLIGIGGLLSALLVNADTGWAVLLPGFALTGIGTGISVPVISRTATAAVGDGRAGMASGAVNSARQLGQAFGIALLGSLAAVTAAATLPEAGVPDPGAAAGTLLGGGAQVLLAAAGSGRATVDQVLHAAFASALDLTFVVAGTAAVVTGLVVAVLLWREPAEGDRRPRSTGNRVPARS